MSKQSEAKQSQCYKTMGPACSTCKHFNSKKIRDESKFGYFTKETDMRCGIGGFAVKKMGHCQLWKENSK